jgi:hypothetical protein
MGVAVIAVGLIVGNVVGTLLASIGAILVTVALLSVVYDAYLKDVLIGEVYDALGIQQSLRAIDLREIAEKDQIDLASVLEDAIEIKVLPLDPVSWLLQDWPRVVAAAGGSTKADVTVYLPSQDAPYIDVLASRLEADVLDLTKQIVQLPDQLADSWDQKQIGASGASLQVILYSAVPAIGILATQRRILLEIPPSLKYATADRGSLALVFGNTGWSGLVEDFAFEQLKDERIPAYSRSVMRPLDGSTSPDAQATAVDVIDTTRREDQA